MTIEGLAKELQLLTISGNSIPIERCTIKAKDLALIVQPHQLLVDALLAVTTAVMCEGADDSWTIREADKANLILNKIIEEEIKE